MELTENDTYRISEGIDFPEVILPDYYNGKKVTEIGNGAFSECKSMKTLVIGNCVTAIGANAFGECTLLTDVVLPDSVTDVGKYSNLVLVDRRVHELIHATNPNTVGKYKTLLGLKNNQIEKLNVLREKAGLDKIF